MLNRFDHLIQTSKFADAVNIVLAAGKIRSRQAFLSKPAAIGSTSHDRFLALATQIGESGFGEPDGFG